MVRVEGTGDFQFNDDRVIDHDIRGEVPHFDASIHYHETALLYDSHACFPKFEGERIFVNTFNKTHPRRIRNSKRTADYLTRNLVQTYYIRVHHLISVFIGVRIQPQLPTGLRRFHTVPTVLIFARGNISSCDKTAVPGLTRSTMARTWARIPPLLSTTGNSPPEDAFS